jgi:hypothetical protein
LGMIFSENRFPLFGTMPQINSKIFSAK